MLHLGMDVSKKEVVFYADREGKHYTVDNSFQKIKSFLQKHQFDLATTLIGCEATADYHNQPCLACLSIGYSVKVLNPILTKQIINATVRKKKTDYSDAQIVAKLLADGYGQSVTSETFHQTKRTIVRTEQKLVSCASTLKRVYQILKARREYMEVDEPIKALERCIGVLEKESAKLTKRATEQQNRQEEIIDSVPGCGEKLATIISAEAGDIQRFPSSRQFKAYVGIDPQVSQSGLRSHTGHITKRGNSLLRHALFLAANIGRQHDPDLKAFYEKKRLEGKSYRHAVCAVTRKLCERIYAIVSKNVLYQIKSIP